MQRRKVVVIYSCIRKCDNGITIARGLAGGLEIDHRCNRLRLPTPYASGKEFHSGKFA